MIVDAHAHLDSEEFRTDLDAVLQEAHTAGVERIICPAINAASARRVLELARTHSTIAPAVGIHPNYAAEAQPGDWAIIESLAADESVVAIGETGLDRYWDFTPWATQEDYFDRHLWLAVKTQLPVIVHCRDAESDVLRHLKAAANRGLLIGVIHAFSSSAEWAQEFVNIGFYISFAGSVTYRNRKFDAVRQAVTAVPGDRLLVETDSPYLVPEPYRGKLKRNYPGLVVEVVRAVSRLRQLEFSAMCEQVTMNARRLFRKL